MSKIVVLLIKPIAILKFSLLSPSGILRSLILSHFPCTESLSDGRTSANLIGVCLS